jgi:DNA mismatch repair protein MutH
LTFLPGDWFFIAVTFIQFYRLVQQGTSEQACPRMRAPGSSNGTTQARQGRFQWDEEPRDLSELQVRAQALSGLTLGELARDGGVDVPAELRRAKGWVGTLIERALGAQSGSRAQPDYPELGVELKTLPIDASGKPLESTFVCTIELSQIADSEWESSRLWKKLRHVLFVPVEGTRTLAVSSRRIATPFFFRPEGAEERALRDDWENLSLLIAQGRTSEITGHLGEVLQVRPKAARGSSRRRTHDESGALYDEQPKGFYLRPAFTHSILKRVFAL